MLKPEQFDAVFKRGTRVLTNPVLSVQVLAQTSETARLGFAVARKMLSSAVARNAFKRCCRESFRRQRSRLPSVDIVISARKGARDVTCEQLVQHLEVLWQRLIDRSTPRPP